MVTSIFSFSHIFSALSKTEINSFSNIQFVFYKCFEFGRILSFGEEVRYS